MYVISNEVNATQYKQIVYRDYTVPLSGLHHEYTRLPTVTF